MHKLDWEEDGGKEEDGEEDGGIKFKAWGNDKEAKLMSSPARRRRGRRKAIHRYWKEWKLICKHTYLLSSGRRRQRCGRIKDGVGKYSREPRRRDVVTDGDNLSEEALKARKEEAEEDRRYKLGRFVDALKSYADRFADIVEDELSNDGDDSDDGANDGHYQSLQFYSSSLLSSFASSANCAAAAASIIWADHDKYGTAPTSDDNGGALISPLKWSMSNGGLRRFIEEEYGNDNPRILMAQTLLRKSEDMQLKVSIFLTSLLAGGDNF
jgi:hypothetical protein